MLCAWPQVSRISLLSPKRVKVGAGRTDVPVSPFPHSCTSPFRPHTATASANILVTTWCDENISMEDRVCNVSDMCSYFTVRTGSTVPGQQ